MDDFFAFRRMLTPLVIQVVFALGVVVAFLVGGLVVGQGIRHHHGGEIAVGVLTIVLGPLLVRLYCELVIVIFRINETLTDMRALAVWTAEREHESDSSDQ